MRTIKIFSLLLMSMLFASCDTGDDLEDIFISHPWTLSYFKEGVNITSPKNDAAYKMTFYDETFVLTTKNGVTITGNWTADNKDRTFVCSKVRVNGGSIRGDSIAQKAEHILKNARYYEGDTNWLQIQIQKNIFMQFHNK